MSSNSLHKKKTKSLICWRQRLNTTPPHRQRTIENKGQPPQRIDTFIFSRLFRWKRKRYRLGTVCMFYIWKLGKFDSDRSVTLLGLGTFFWAVPELRKSYAAQSEYRWSAPHKEKHTIPKKRCGVVECPTASSPSLLLMTPGLCCKSDRAKSIADL